MKKIALLGSVAFLTPLIALADGGAMYTGVIGYALHKTAPDWLSVSSSDAFKSYVEPTSLRENGLERTVWTLHNFGDAEPSVLELGAELASDKSADKSAENTPAKVSEKSSQLTLEQYHCQREEWRTLQQSTYRELYAKGEVVSSSASPSEWKRIIPTSHQGVLFRYVCTRPASRSLASFFRKPNLYLFLR